MHKKLRNRLCELFDREDGGIIYMKGAGVQSRYGTDYEYPFRQESDFLYLTGVYEADFHLLLEPATRICYLFAPKRDAQYAVWHGHVYTLDEYRQRYQPDYICYDTDLPDVLDRMKPEKVYCLNEEAAASMLELGYKTDMDTLRDHLDLARSQKTGEELDLMRYAGKISSEAHVEVLRALRPGMMEYELKAVFDYYHLRRGLTQEAYTGIYGSGVNSAILHYVANNDRINDGELVLIDAGYEYKGYAHDITRTYPANGRFTPDQAAVYDAVLEAHKSCIKAIRPGMRMEDLHLMAARIMMEGLLRAGIVMGDLDEIIEKSISALFFPHGLGHLLGLDTHDVGGFVKDEDEEESDRPGMKNLRTRRTLEPGMVVTIEPGLYFIPALLNPAFEDPEKASFLNVDRLKTMLDFGGIRIEDDIVVTEEGYEDLTNVPKEREEIEAIMRESREASS